MTSPWVIAALALGALGLTIEAFDIRREGRELGSQSPQPPAAGCELRRQAAVAAAERVVRGGGSRG